jgi:dihydropyrimidinase
MNGNGRLAVCGGLVVTPDGAREADLLVEGETIEAVEAPAANHPGRTVIDATGCVVLPGAVDAHVHVHIPYVRLDGEVVRSSDGFPEASVAAALGGTTTIVDFAMQDEGQDLLGPLAARLEFVERSTVDVALHCWILDPNERALTQLPELVAHGVPSVKVFMAYSQLGTPMSDGELYELMQATGKAGGLVQVHAENAGLNARAIERARRTTRTGFEHFAASRPALGEEEAVSRALLFAHAAGTPVYFVHLSTAAAVRRLAAARAAGQAAFGETCPHFLLFDESRYLGRRAGDFLMAPPLRTTADREALWAALRAGELDVVATDHTAWPRAVKNYGTGFLESIQGVAGLGLLLPLLAASDLGWETLARVTAENPARIFGLHPRKGVLQPGSDADLVVLDPSARSPVADVPPSWSVDNCIYAGLPAVHPRHVLRRGTVLVEDGRYVGPASGTGVFVPGDLSTERMRPLTVSPA